MAAPTNTRFHECRPTEWNGRYARIPGDGTVFHLKVIDGRLWPVVLWDTEGARATCRARQCDAAAQIADAVAAAKRRLGGDGGGCFLINEFGQILVPASDGRGRRYVVGHIEGGLLFENPFCPQEPIDLGESGNLRTGDPWRLPYVGVPYNLHGRRSEVYFYKQDESRGAAVYPARQDQELIRALRALRPHGAVRFIVNPAGLALTKRPVNGNESPEDSWMPVFVGTISPNHWFEKE